jgi:hypothetical protein
MSLRSSVILKAVLASLLVLSGCASRERPKTMSLIKMDPEGTLQEQLAYHHYEMKKYEVAAKEERENAIAYLKKQQMNEVRQAYSRRAQYLKKVEEHEKYLEELSKAE